LIVVSHANFDLALEKRERVPKSFDPDLRHGIFMNPIIFQLSAFGIDDC
jgi:hypothetical protein